MAVAIQTKRAVRGVTAVAERPDGIRVKFQPFPTPVIGKNGELLAAVNLLIDITDDSRLDPREDRRSSQRERVEQALQTFTTAEVQELVEQIETTLGRRPPRVLN